MPHFPWTNKALLCIVRLRLNSSPYHPAQLVIMEDANNSFSSFMEFGSSDDMKAHKSVF